MARIVFKRRKQSQFTRRVRSWSPRRKVRPPQSNSLSAVQIQGPIAAPGGSDNFVARDF